MAYLFESEEHAQLRETVRRFAQRHVAPNARAWEEAGELPRELYRTAGDAGLLGVGYPTDTRSAAAPGRS
jgi:acyl-CoA dehydrogenase